MEQIYILKESNRKISDSADLFKNIKKIKIDYSQENFIVFYLNSQNEILKSENLFKGGVDSCLICPKILFRNALLNNSGKIIIAHNHPSNNLKPSYEDEEIYLKLKEAGEIIGIKVLDSIIFNKKEFYSLIV